MLTYWVDADRIDWASFRIIGVGNRSLSGIVYHINARTASGHAAAPPTTAINSDRSILAPKLGRGHGTGMLIRAEDDCRGAQPMSQLGVNGGAAVWCGKSGNGPHRSR
jgi:hypothetical protein